MFIYPKKCIADNVRRDWKEFSNRRLQASSPSFWKRVEWAQIRHP